MSSHSQPDERGTSTKRTATLYSQVVGDNADPEYILVLPITRLQEDFRCCVAGSSGYLDLGFRVGSALLVLIQDLR
jgi:hypothetical protein